MRADGPAFAVFAKDDSTRFSCESTQDGASHGRGTALWKAENSMHAQQQRGHVRRLWVAQRFTAAI